MNTLAVDNMDLEEVRTRLLDAFRNGRLSIDLKGVVLGFARAMKGKKGPSPRQIEIARKLVREIRSMDGTEPVILLDDGDNPVGREQSVNYADFDDV